MRVNSLITAANKFDSLDMIDYWSMLVGHNRIVHSLNHSFVKELSR